MPWIDPDPAQVAAPVYPFGQDIPPERIPGWGETMAAAFRQNNTLVNLYDYLVLNDLNQRIEPGYNAIDEIRGTIYEQYYLDRFPGSRNREHTRALMKAIDEERAAADVIRRAGPWGVAVKVAVEEIVLQATQQTRTPEESLVTIGASALFGALLMLRVPCCIPEQGGGQGAGGWHFIPTREAGPTS